MNFSPQLISRQFEQAIKQTSFMELSRRGFTSSKKDTPNYHLIILLQVDSYYVYGQRFGSLKYAPTYKYISTISKTQLDRPATNMVKELTFHYKMEKAKYRETVWENHEDLYFFNREKRDIPRSVGMVKYALSKFQ